jgi:sulfhydrogenase subunit beta (sulfur reductase)
MADTGYLPKEKEKEFFAALSKDRLLYVPCVEGDTVLFRVYSPESEICFDRPANSPPKPIIYPQSETLFSFAFKKNADEPQKMSVEIDEKVESPEMVILGARPCDAKGFKIYDRPFLDTDTPDPYYRERREKTTVITVSCPQPSAGCFCTAVGGGPADKEGSDAIMTELDKGWFIEPLTEKGKAVLKYAFIEDGAAHRQEAQAGQEAAHKAVKNPFGKEGLPRIDETLFNLDEFWDQAVEKCLSCGACTYLCPTCYCFNITDEQAVNKGERVRSWDACMFPHFTLEASGHNPRPRKQNRFRNRVGHKFVWYPEKYEGAIACCGCGRCIRYCPVSVDISEIVGQLAASRPNAPEGGPGNEEKSSNTGSLKK